MPKFFQTEIAAYGGEKTGFTNVKFKKPGTFENTSPAETGTLLEIIPIHIKDPPVIQFMAYLDILKETFSPQYSKEQPFGRPDAYVIWKSSERKISLAWSIFSSSVSSGLDNLNNLSWFLAALYPAYKDVQSATSIAATPLFRVRYANLISSPTADGQGILCAISNVTVTPDFKDGFISVSPKNSGTNSANIDAKLLKAAGFERSFREGKKILVPKSIKVGCSLEIIHDHRLGWDFNTGEWRGGLSAPGFPYNFGLIRDTQDPAQPVDSGATAEAPGSSCEDNVCVPGNPSHTEADVNGKTLLDASADSPLTPGIEHP